MDHSSCLGIPAKSNIHLPISFQTTRFPVGISRHIHAVATCLGWEGVRCIVAVLAPKFIHVGVLQWNISGASRLDNEDADDRCHFDHPFCRAFHTCSWSEWPERAVKLKDSDASESIYPKKRMCRYIMAMQPPVSYSETMHTMSRQALLNKAGGPRGTLSICRLRVAMPSRSTSYVRSKIKLAVDDHRQSHGVGSAVVGRYLCPDFPGSGHGTIVCTNTSTEYYTLAV